MDQRTKMVISFVLVLSFMLGVSRAHVKEKWDTLILTQSWPPGECVFFESRCRIPSVVKTWVIHGLWPTLKGTVGPNYCNKSWEFDIQNVKSLEPKLLSSWPSIDEKEQSQHVWCHEWDKHGTCGSSLAAITDQWHYFNVTLGLHYRFDMATILASGKVVPSNDQSYSYSQVREAVHGKTGSNPNLLCVKNRSDGKCYLEQIELCMTPTFEPVDCVPHATRRQTLLFRSKDKCRLSTPVLTSSEDCNCQKEDIYYKPMPSCKRNEVSENNIREFCSDLPSAQKDGEERSTCARVDSAYVSCVGCTSHVRVTRVFNPQGPQTRGGYRDD
ncbi:hypothetical protein ACOMHN_008990 [Nucella lapillus]